MENDETSIRTSAEIAVSPRDAFEYFVDELTWTLDDSGFGFESGPDGRFTRGEYEVGRVTSWNPGEDLEFEWRPAAWEPASTTEITFRFDSIDGGTRITMEHRGLDELIENRPDMVGWFATEVVAPHLVATSPDAFGDWLTDREGRRPTGDAAREEYGDPLYHYPNFRVILEELALGPDDHLLEVGCGGGVLLAKALESGCRASAIDHSPEMVRLAKQTNRDAVETGRLDVREADAEALPFEDGTFSCATMTSVLGHLPNPIEVFSEIHRVLADGGRIVILGSDPELRGTPAAPEPMASRMNFYEKRRTRGLAHEAGFDDSTLFDETWNLTLVTPACRKITFHCSTSRADFFSPGRKDR
ncbi:hypothetical protein C2R22_20995 (plasmid) [Salinigranum rubrum]|uniref:Uncharacterized protein n=1 Tax=Salinigranum rubrum TaxID=755307 RepID=A0A2I8VQR5_9EURY|nr:methyltransferase domain-containing protein [Salinigranum rubrum]AUV84258.1 hypothetical protein C2R22_20995 [Salinigranum rubrum]